jgi:hypothetical protein
MDALPKGPLFDSILISRMVILMVWYEWVWV